MADLRRIIPQYFDVEGSRRVDKNGTAFNTPKSPMTLYRGTQVLFQAHLMMADATTYFAPPSSATWYFGIDSAYTRDHADLVQSLDAVFNIADDWTSINETGGKICWRADLSTTELKADLADAATKAMYCGLWMYPQPGASPTLMAHWDITMHNVAVDPTTATDLTPETYITTTNLALMIEQVTIGGIKSMRFYDADGGIIGTMP